MKPAARCQDSPSRSPLPYVARGVAALTGDSDKRRFAGQVVTARQLADEYGITDTDGSRPDCWGLIDQHGWDDHEPEVINGTGEGVVLRGKH